MYICSYMCVCVFNGAHSRFYSSPFTSFASSTHPLPPATRAGGGAVAASPHPAPRLMRPMPSAENVSSASGCAWHGQIGMCVRVCVCVFFLCACAYIYIYLCVCVCGVWYICKYVAERLQNDLCIHGANDYVMCVRYVRWWECTRAVVALSISCLLSVHSAQRQGGSP